jgi:hypothetical protein
MEDAFWDEDFDEIKPSRRGRQPRLPKEPRSRKLVDRAKIIERYKMMQIQNRDEHGNYFSLRKQTR